MQFKLAVLLLIFPVILFGQKLNCCKTIEEVKHALKGDWVLEGVDSKTIYKFWFENDSGGMDEMVKTDVDGEYISLSCQPFVEIVKKRRKFQMLLTHMVETEVFNIEKLNSKRLLLKNKEREVVYLKVNN